MFSTADLFHMGADEVYFECWNTSESLQKWMKENKGWGLENDDFMKLWGYFQENALIRLDKAYNREIPVIVWSSSLTHLPQLTQYLDKNRYVIQVWDVSESVIKDILNEGYKIILSNVDALYLDCGFSSWVSSGLNSCAPFKGWQKLYDNDLKKFGEEQVDQILGAEAALWSEQADHNTIDSRLWPRLSALAERLWSDPEESWKSADSRMLVHHRRLIQHGIKADRLQPEWCLKNEGQCPI